jgi:hypothetical protein
MRVSTTRSLDFAAIADTTGVDEAEFAANMRRLPRTMSLDWCNR